MGHWASNRFFFFWPLGDSESSHFPSPNPSAVLPLPTWYKPDSQVSTKGDSWPGSCLSRFSFCCSSLCTCSLGSLNYPVLLACAIVLLFFDLHIFVHLCPFLENIILSLSPITLSIRHFILIFPHIDNPGSIFLTSLSLLCSSPDQVTRFISSTASWDDCSQHSSCYVEITVDLTAKVNLNEEDREWVFIIVLSASCKALAHNQVLNKYCNYFINILSVIDVIHCTECWQEGSIPASVNVW